MPRGVHNDSPVARSRYRQLRLTLTQEASGRLSYSIYGKALNAAWSEHQCIVRSTVECPAQSIATTEDALRLLLAVLEEHLLPLPGIDPT